MTYGRGDIILVDLQPTVGSEQGFKRPCIIISDLVTIKASRSRPLYIIVPLTRSEKLTGVLAPRLKASQGGLPADSTALIMHLRSIDPKRVLRKVGKLEPNDLKIIREGLQKLFEF